MTACASDKTVPHKKLTTTYLTIRNLFVSTKGLTIKEFAYGVHLKQNATYYIKDNIREEPLEVIVFIHGGGWQGGDKGIWHKHSIELARSFNFKIYNINYRLGSIENAVADSRYFINNLKQSGKKIIVIGFSAGAHIALYLAEKNLIDGAIAYAPPTDLTGSNSTVFLDNFLKKGGLDPLEAKKYSPLYMSMRADSDSKVPIYLIYSTQDHFVSYFQAMNYYLTKQNKVDITLKQARGEHGFQFNMRRKQNKNIWEFGVKPFIRKIFEIPPLMK